jgi:6-pyruvoyltetrahydropterin/6-carboxytetrahydropterin synthase
MVVLTRTVRFAVNPPCDRREPGASTTPGSRHTERANGYAGVPALSGLGSHYEAEISVCGEPDAITGYFRDIKVIDEATRATLVPSVSEAMHVLWHDGGQRAPDATAAPRAIHAVMRPLSERLGGVLHSVRLMLSPYHSWEVRMSDADTALLRQRFEFSAAHRLYVPSMSEDENRRIFGKCSHASGHGHNYVLEVCVSVPLGTAGNTLSLGELEAVVYERVIARLDHKHLNLDVPEFDQSLGGVNPSVENIARVCHDLLRPSLDSPRGRLHNVTVWETEKTSATYPAVN